MRLIMLFVIITMLHFLGVAGVLTYFEPLRPIFGVLSIGLLGTALFNKARGFYR